MSAAELKSNNHKKGIGAAGINHGAVYCVRVGRRGKKDVWKMAPLSVISGTLSRKQEF